MTDELLRPADVAARHPGLTEALLEKHRRAGTGPAWFRRGKRAVAYLASDVDAWIERQRQQAAS
jgi:predicted DNA-binding transcriptional regulator AlpA